MVVVDNKILGEGGFSQVKLGTDAGDFRKKYALKRILLQSSEDEASASLEINYLKAFIHPNIVSFLGCSYTIEEGRKVVYLLFPLVSRGTLRHRWNAILEGNAAPFKLPHLLSSFSAIMSACALLHNSSPSYVHRDIKPENILLSDDDMPLLTDFGSVGKAVVKVNNRSDVSRSLGYSTR